MGEVVGRAVGVGVGPAVVGAMVVGSMLVGKTVFGTNDLEGR